MINKVIIAVIEISLLMSVYEWICICMHAFVSVYVNVKVKESVLVFFEK